MKDLKKKMDRIVFDANKKTSWLPLPCEKKTIEKARKKIQNGDYLEAIRILEDDLNTVNDPYALNLKSLCFIYSRDYDAALKVSDNAVNQYYIELSGVFSNRSVIFMAKHSYEEAEKAALKSRDFFPYWHGPHLNLFAVYNRTERFQDIETAAQKMYSLWQDCISNNELIDHLKNDTDLKDILYHSKFLYDHFILKLKGGELR